MNVAITKSDGSGYHLLTNEGLSIGDKVFSILSGYHTNGKFYLMRVDTDDYLSCPDKILACTEFPSDPHTITEFFVDDGLKYIRTDKGYSPAETYFKLEVNDD